MMGPKGALYVSVTCLSVATAWQSKKQTHRRHRWWSDYNWSVLPRTFPTSDFDIFVLARKYHSHFQNFASMAWMDEKVRMEICTTRVDNRLDCIVTSNVRQTLAGHQGCPHLGHFRKCQRTVGFLMVSDTLRSMVHGKNRFQALLGVANLIWKN